MLIYDEDDCAVVLSEEMDFDCIYKIKFLAVPTMSHVPN
jgi:hypothetical protein